MLLRQILRRTHTRIAVTAVAVTSGLLLIAGVMTMHASTQENLSLIARALVYNVEPALVFGDRTDATQSLARMVQDEGVGEAVVRDAQGALFAQWSEPGRLPCCGPQLVEALGIEAAHQEVVSNGHVIGSISVRSNGERLMGFVFWALLALVACMAASVVVGHIVSRRMHRSIMSPLEELGRVARVVHRERAMGQRVPRADIAELRELGEDFNALLDELEARQFHLQQENMALEHKAYHDGLTGVFNRVYFELRLISDLRHAAQTDGRLAMLFLDLNRFKEVNDTYGHALGDALLVAVAQRIQSQVRDSDLVARLGGDEFVVALLEPHSVENVEQVARKIEEAVCAPLRCEGGLVLHPSVSVGMAMFPEGGNSLASLMEAADSSMYADKLRRRQSVASAEIDK